MAKTTKVEVTGSDGLRVALYARFSTEDQNPRSTEDQIAQGHRELRRLGGDNCRVAEFKDEALSGELISRPGIDGLRKQIRERRVDLIITEDVSRLFRDRSEPHKFAGLCVDNGVRLIASHDRVDTNQVEWEDAIHRAAERHAVHNDDSAHRIHRAYDARWEAGHAVAAAPPGYANVAVDPQCDSRRNHSRLRIEKIETWSRTVEELFERAARGDRLSAIATYLNKEQFPTSHNSRLKRHSSHTVATLIKNTIYRGAETAGKTRTEKRYSTGQHIAVRNAPDQQKTRPMPHLRFVSDLLWRQANDALAGRDLAHGRHPYGANHCLSGIPRDSRSPLANHFFCAICGSKMIGQGRATGGYRCGAALEDKCWNKASVCQNIAVPRVYQAVAEHLLRLNGAEEVLVELARQVSQNDENLDEQRQSLLAELRTVKTEISRFADAVANHGASKTLMGMLQEREQRQETLQFELDELREQLSITARPVEAGQVMTLASAAAASFAESNDDARELLRVLTTPIRAVPFQRLDCGLVVLKARFQINLVQLLPEHWRQLAKKQKSDLSQTKEILREVEVPLYDEPLKVRLAAQATEAYSHGLRSNALAEALVTNPKTAYEAMGFAAWLAQDRKSVV